MKILKIIISFCMSMIFGSVLCKLGGFSIHYGSVEIMPMIFGLPMFSLSFLHMLPRGALFMAPYVEVDVDKPGPNSGMGGKKKDRILTFKWDDVVTTGLTRDDKKIRVVGNLNFKPGKYMTSVYATQDTIKTNDKTQGDSDAKSVNQSVAFRHPGDQVAIEEYKANWMDENCGIIIQECGSQRMRLYGWPCSPLKLDWEGGSDKDKTGSELTFATAQGGPCVAEYEGTLTLSSVTGTVAADETDVDLTNGAGQYQLTDNTVATVLTTGTNAVNGLVFTLLGSGGVHPTSITSANDFILIDGTTWNALAGSAITFKAIKTGVATWKFVELSRS